MLAGSSRFECCPSSSAQRQKDLWNISIRHINIYIYINIMVYDVVESSFALRTAQSCQPCGVRPLTPQEVEKLNADGSRFQDDPFVALVHRQIPWLRQLYDSEVGSHRTFQNQRNKTNKNQTITDLKGTIFRPYLLIVLACL